MTSVRGGTRKTKALTSDRAEMQGAEMCMRVKMQRPDAYITRVVVSVC